MSFSDGVMCVGFVEKERAPKLFQCVQCALCMVRVKDAMERFGYGDGTLTTGWTRFIFLV